MDERTIDVREMPPPGRHPLIFEALGSLTPGASVELVNDHDPRPLFHQLAAEQPGTFTWEYLEEGPTVWRVRIGRVASGGDPARASGHDGSSRGGREVGHRQARELMTRIGERLEAGGLGAAVAVVDAHGELVAFLRTDGCRLPSITIAINKAFTAAREAVESSVLGERSRTEGFPLTNFGDPRYVGWGGGVPIVVDGAAIGAIGVSGLPEAEDVELARWAVASLAAEG
jgi:glc operon protein GlcG